MLKTIPLFSYRFWFENYKLKSFHTKIWIKKSDKEIAIYYRKRHEKY